MQYADASDKFAQYRQQIAQLRGKMRDLQQSVEPQEVSDYEFSTTEGKVRLSELFGDKEYLFVIHNMGAGCPNCTLWADGFNGILRILKIALPLSSPRRTSRQRNSSSRAARGWRFRMVSYLGTGFARDMGYHSDEWLAARRVGVPQTRANNLARL